MAVSPERMAEILRLYHAEKMKVGTIARMLHVHRETVERVLERDGITLAVSRPRPSQIDAYRDFIVATWTQHPTLTASTLYRMCCERGFCGSPDHFRHQVARMRPQPTAEAYLRLRPLPGAQGQVDWGHFGIIRIGRAERRLMAFVLVLSWSRQIFLRFYLGAHVEAFLRGHIAAFETWGGVPRRILHDNLKSAVLERYSTVIRFHPRMLELAARYRFEPRAAAPYRGNEKGRVERSIRYVRSSFWPGRAVRSLVELNRDAEQWCIEVAGERPWPEDRRRTVSEAFAEERESLMALPDDALCTEEVRETRVQKTPYVRFDRNEYSVPSALVRKTVVVRASEDVVYIEHGGSRVARHARSYDTGDVAEDPEHVRELVGMKKAAREGRGQHRLFRAAPEAEALLSTLAERNENLGSIVSQLLALLDHYGAKRVRHAMREAAEQNTPHPRSVRHLLETRMEVEQTAPPLALDLPEDPRIRELTVRPHSLKDYESLAAPPVDSEETNETVAPSDHIDPHDPKEDSACPEP